MPSPGLGWDFERIARPMRKQAIGTPCPYCGAVMTTGRGPQGATVDHILARALGGSNDPTNLRVMCKRCNCRLGQVLGMKSPRRAARRRPRVPGGVFGPLSS